MTEHFTDEEIKQIGDNWNKLGNLQLLNNEKNISKQDKSLIEWVKMYKLDSSFLFVDKEISLEITDFTTFYANRVSNMKQKLLEIVR